MPQSIISFTIAIVILWTTGVIRISSLIASTSISYVALLVWRVNYPFEKTALERFEVNDLMTWATLHWREKLAPKNAHLVHFKSISSSNYHDWDHTLHQIRYCVHDTLIGVLKVWNTKTLNALLQTFTGKGLSNTLVSLAPSVTRLLVFRNKKIDLTGYLLLKLSQFSPTGDGWHIVKTENQVDASRKQVSLQVSEIVER